MNNTHKTNAQGKNEPRHVMIDIEMMALTPDAAIISIGAITFDPIAAKYGRTFYRELAWKDQGRHICPDTQAFWGKQSDEAKQALNGAADLYDTLIEFADWMPAGATVWGNGPETDITLLNHAYRQELIPIPWAFYRVQSCRTIINLWEVMTGSIIHGINANMAGTAHNALDDAKNQAKEITRMYRVIVDSYWKNCKSNKNSNVVSVIGHISRNK